MPEQVSAYSNEDTNPQAMPGQNGKVGLLQRLSMKWLKNGFIGMVLCQTLVTSVVVVGWTYRLIQRSVVRQWWRLSGAEDKGVDFAEWAGVVPEAGRFRHMPNWFVRQHPDAVSRKRKLRECVADALHSFRFNLKLGVQGILNTWLLTLPGCSFWLFAWYDGWNNSFHKGYERAAVGPLTGIFGIVLFIAVMFYVPLAQTRQAVTGQWRRFYDFKVVWRVIKTRWVAVVGLAALYTFVSVPIMVLKTAPAFFPQFNPALSNLNTAEALRMLNQYFFWSALVFFPAYLAVRLVAARIYAGGIVRSLQRGILNAEQLSQAERNALKSLALEPAHPIQLQPRSRLGRMSAGIGLLAFSAVVAVLWFTFVAQIFVAEFFNFHPWVGWLNQPLVQLPWFRYLP